MADNSLCLPCKSVFEAYLKNGSLRLDSQTQDILPVHHRNYEAWHRAVEDGCSICSNILIQYRVKRGGISFSKWLGYLSDRRGHSLKSRIHEKAEFEPMEYSLIENVKSEVFAVAFVGGFWGQEAITVRIGTSGPWFGKKTTFVKWVGKSKGLQLTYEDRERLRIKSLLSRVQDSNALCTGCSNINFTEGGTWTHHSGMNLSLSAKSGCQMCNMFLQGAIDAFKGQRGSDFQNSTRLCTVTVEKSKYILDYHAQDNIGGRRLGFEICLPADSPLANNQSNPFRTVRSDPTSSSSLNLIKRWLEECESGHTLCGSFSQYPNDDLPTHLIDLSGTIPILRQNVSSGSRYAILTYCWGSNTFLKTTRANLPQHENGISLDSIAPTVRDAIRFIKLLGIQYLWVDALCIIQDCSNHWNVESQKMATYYENAYITLSAAQAEGAQDGFLKSRESSNIYTLPHLSGITLRARSFDTSFKTVQMGTLNQRAWAFQERLLSKRVLHVTQMGFFWECRTLSKSEGNMSISETNQRCSNAISGGPDFMKILLFTFQESDRPMDFLYNMWHQIVRHFSRRSITFLSDRLPAISGIAKTFSSRTKSEYLAGIWKNNPEDLLWFRDSPDYRVSQAKSPDFLTILDQNGLSSTLASLPTSSMSHSEAVILKESRQNSPSWSWSSLTESVLYRFEEDDEKVHLGDTLYTTIVNEKLETEGHGAYGRVTSGHILIKSRTKTAYLYNEPRCGFPGLPAFVCSASIVEAEILKEPPCSKWDFIRDTQIGTAMMDDDQAHEGTRVRIAEISRRTRIWLGGNHERKKIIVIYFLVLECTEPESDSWKRIGAGMTVDFESRNTFEGAFDYAEWDVIKIV